MECIEKKCNDVRLLMMVQDPRQQEEEFKNKIKLCDCVIVNGEGSLHHDQGVAVDIFRLCILAKNAGKRVFLINSVWEGNTLLDELVGIFDKIYVRESFSQKLLNKIGISAEVVADLSFFHTRHARSIQVKKGCDLMYIDSWHTHVSRFLYKKSCEDKAPFFRMTGLEQDKIYRTNFFRKPQVCQLMNSSFDVLSNKGVCVTGRFHGAAIAIAFGFPVVAIGSNTHKIEGLLYDVFGSDWEGVFIPPNLLDEEQLEKKIAFVQNNYLDLQHKVRRYSIRAKVDIDIMFKSILSWS